MRYLVKRRTLLAAMLAAVVGTVPLVRAASAHAAPQAIQVAGGAGTAQTWKWVALPDSGGLQVHCTAANSAASVRVSWTADGVVTAAWPTPLTVTAPAGPGVQALTSGGGYGLAVRRAP